MVLASIALSYEWGFSENNPTSRKQLGDALCGLAARRDEAHRYQPLSLVYAHYYD